MWVVGIASDAEPGAAPDTATWSVCGSVRMFVSRACRAAVQVSLLFGGGAQRMNWLSEKLTDLLRPWHDDGLPEELAFGEIEAWGFVRGSMARFAQMAARLDVPLGVFGIIGIGYARRAAQAWWPKERLLMEDVSCAYQPIQSRAGSAHPVPQLLIDRLVLVLARYLTYVRSPWPEAQLREAIARFLEDYPRNVPESVSEDAEQEAEPDAAPSPAGG